MVNASIKQMLCGYLKCFFNFITRYGTDGWSGTSITFYHAYSSELIETLGMPDDT